MRGRKKGYKHSDETKKKISESEKGKLVSKETREKIRKSRIGKSQYLMTNEIKEKISINHAKHWKGKVGSEMMSWKGDKASYSAKHRWIESIKGKPKKCEECRTESAKKFEWANIDHKYSRNPDDYIRLCHKCHIKLDKALKVDSAKKMNNMLNK